MWDLMSIDRYALCVGINQYASPNTLSGCVNDANDWAALLTKQGYSVTSLLDLDATRDNVLRTLTELVGILGYRDRLVFTFSGHGTSIPDYNGDEVDGKDEVIVTQELDYIADDDLRNIFSKKAFGSRIVMLSDSCHSGSVNRFVDLSTEKRTARYISPEYVGERAVPYATTKSTVGGAASVLISGCADDEYSYDAWFGNRPNGAFTRTAIDTFVYGQTIGSWHDEIRKRLPSQEYPQSPQLSASYYKSRWAALG